ncbi:MAG: hypothetical protein J7K72_00220 [Candidatus Aenigmarchaeota archaeon]|nr:hypothetical protein [Candidatus Aenigmarchaeota archaeon]
MFSLLLILFLSIFLMYSKYMVRTRLDVNLINQSSGCYSGQEIGSKAEWNNSGILVDTAFEVADPCYVVYSIKAYQQGDRIEVKIKVNPRPESVCIQCFGYMRLRYKILSPKMENEIHIHVDVEGIAGHDLKLSRLVHSSSV